MTFDWLLLDRLRRVVERGLRLLRVVAATAAEPDSARERAADEAGPQHGTYLSTGCDGFGTERDPDVTGQVRFNPRSSLPLDRCDALAKELFPLGRREDATTK